MNSVPLHDGGPATRVVSAMPGGAEITLRPTGSTSGSPGLFLVGGLIGMAIGTLMAVELSGRLMTIVHPITFPEFLTALSRPEALLSLCFYAFILLWVVVWNLGSGAALVTALRLSFGSDVFRLSREEWWVRRGIGRVGRKRVLRGRDVRVFLHKGDYGLFARKGEELIFLTDFGTVNDRRWLRDELRSRFGIPAGSTSEEGLPPAWSSLQLSDGALQLRESRASGRAKIGCVGIPAALWSFGLFLFVLRDGVTLGTMIGSVVGLPLIALTIGYLLGRDEWVARPRRLDRIQGFGPWTRRRSFENGTLEILLGKGANPEPQDPTGCLLVVCTTDGEKVTITGSGKWPTDVFRVGRWLEKRTRFPLKVTPGAETDEAE